jgi:hypothetical protein
MTRVVSAGWFAMTRDGRKGKEDTTQQVRTTPKPPCPKKGTGQNNIGLRGIGKRGIILYTKWFFLTTSIRR